MVADPQSAGGGLCSILNFRLGRIYNFGDRSICIFWHFAYSRPFLEAVGGRILKYFPK